MVSGRFHQRFWQCVSVSYSRKAKENRLRRAAKRQGFTLLKSPKRDPKAIGFGTYMLREPRTGSLLIAEGSVGDYGLDLDDIRNYLELRLARISRETAKRSKAANAALVNETAARITSGDDLNLDDLEVLVDTAGGTNKLINSLTVRQLERLAAPELVPQRPGPGVRSPRTSTKIKQGTFGSDEVGTRPKTRAVGRATTEGVRAEAVTPDVRAEPQVVEEGTAALLAAVRDAVAAGRKESARLERVVSTGLEHIEELGLTLSAPNGDQTARTSQAFLDLAEAARRQLSEHFERQRDVLGTFNIALFGRTGAGKSSLVSALAELDGSSVSRGDSDWTEDVKPVPWEGCLLYDTPGINGWGRTRSRAELEDAARGAVEVADVVLLCFDSQSQQATEFAKVADWVQEYGKPVIAVLNSRNLMWRHPARVATAARGNLSKSVRQHAGNIGDALAALGLPGTPIVAIHARHALDARAATPYNGPDQNNHVLRRQEFGIDYLYHWSNLPVLQQLLAATVKTGGARLRLRVLREGTRTTLRAWADSVDLLAREAQTSLEVAERTIEATLAVLGYLERDDRGFLREKGQKVEDLSSLEDLRETPFKAPSVGRLESHVTHLAASHFAGLRAESLKAASASVRAAFDKSAPLSEDDFQAAVFDRAKIDAATALVWKLSGAFLQRELDLVWEEAASDFVREASKIRVDGRAGGRGRFAADALRAAGVVASAAGAVMGIVAMTQFWNPAGWAAALLIGAAGLLSGVFGWFGRKARERAERQRLEARGQALADVRVAVEEAYREMGDALLREVCATARQLHVGTLRLLLREALALRRAVQASGALVDQFHQLADDIPASPPAADVLFGACRMVLDSCPAGSRPDDVWLGEDWLSVESPTLAAPPRQALDRLANLEKQDLDRLAVGLRASWSLLEPADVEHWLSSISQVAAETPGLTEVVALARARLDEAPAVVFVGDYSAGKTSLVKRLLVEAGSRPPDDLVVGAAPTTSAIHEYPWHHLSLVDTPGLQSSRAGHDLAPVLAVEGAALVVMVLHVNLMIGDFSALKAMLTGTEVAAGKSHRTLFLINRSDEFGVDPGGDPEEFVRRRIRKEGELRELLAAQGLSGHFLVHTVAGDPFGLVADRHGVIRDGYQDEFRNWDGIGALTGALLDTANEAPQMRAHAALDVATGALLCYQRDVTTEAQHEAHRCEADKALLRELDNTLVSGELLASSLERKAEAMVRVHAERAATVALSAPSDGLEQAAKTVATWWKDPQFVADAVSFGTQAHRDIDQWMRTARSALTRAFPDLNADLLGTVHLSTKPPRMKGRRAPRGAASATRAGKGFINAAAQRDVVYGLGKALGHNFKPWGAIKLTARVAKVGAVLGVVAVGFDIHSWVSDRRAETGHEKDRLSLAAFVEESIDQVTAQITRGTAPERPLTVVEAVLGDFQEARRAMADEVQAREALAARLSLQDDVIARLLSEAPKTGQEHDEAHN